MNAYEVLRDIHPIGSSLVGTVTGRTEIEMTHGFPGGHVTLDTTSEFRAILPYDHLTDNHLRFDPELIPNLGSQIATVVFNYVDGTLYLSAKPGDLKSSTIREWRDFYAYVNTLSIGREISGVVERAVPFGLFVNIGSPYIGLIDIGHSSYYGGHSLPFDHTTWPLVGESIRCSVDYIRFHNRQIGLGWIPDGIQNNAVNGSRR
jgi:ribosomal protein S1